MIEEGLSLQTGVVIQTRELLVSLTCKNYVPYVVTHTIDITTLGTEINLHVLS